MLPTAQVIVLSISHQEQAKVYVKEPRNDKWIGRGGEMKWSLCFVTLWIVMYFPMLCYVPMLSVP